MKYVLYLYISTAVPKTAVFCRSLISCISGMLLGYCLSDFEMVPVAPIITGITYHIIIIIIIMFSIGTTNTPGTYVTTTTTTTTTTVISSF